MTAGRDARELLEEAMEAIRRCPVAFFPVRHHSPACAHHLQRLIRERRPRAVLVEGPSDMTPLVPHMLHPETRAPFAVYATFVDRANRTGLRVDRGPLRGHPRFSAYYPFCDHSPELVALRAAAEVGAELRFIDLTFPEQTLAVAAGQLASPGDRARSLLEEGGLLRGAYMRALVEGTGCRDPNDLWDHLFEVRFSEMDAGAFVEAMMAYSVVARAAFPEEALAAEGTLAREAMMAREVARAVEELGLGNGEALVVVGGLHVVALPSMVTALLGDGGDAIRAHRLELGPDEAQTVLMRYTFEQLDALNGYSSGMPSPEYYDRVWRGMQEGSEDPLGEAARALLVEVGAITRERIPAVAVSAADEIAASEHVARMAALRGHPSPSREDLLDGIRSCYVRGDLGVEGALVMGVASRVLAGERTGDLPADVGVPPIVEDFRETSRSLGLPLDSLSRRTLRLDIYRGHRHRAISRSLHRLTFLGVPYASLAAGPDFVAGRDLGRLFEEWQVAWSHGTESALIERSRLGTTVEEAALGTLVEAVGRLEEEGRARSAVPSVALLVTACRMGLHQHAPHLLDLVETHVLEDPSFPSLVTAIRELLLLWHSREPLEAHGMGEVPRLAVTAYRRACHLMRDQGQCAELEVTPTLAGMTALNDLLASEREDQFDPDLFRSALRRLSRDAEAEPVLVGGATGVLHATGELSLEDLLVAVRGRLSGTGPAVAAGAAFLRGLLATARELAWQSEELVALVDRRINAWGQEEFELALPELRLAFADLTPREVDRVASVVARSYGKAAAPDLGRLRAPPEAVLMGGRVDELVRAHLERHGLAAWAGARDGGDAP